jgi:hypothetical protein
MMAEFERAMVELGADWDEPAVDGQPEVQIGLPDEQVTTMVDAREFGRQKYDSLAQHASQTENIIFLNLGLARFTELLGIEAFVRVRDTTGAPVPEDDLFAGLRATVG